MRVTKTPAPVETKLDLPSARVELYSADAAAEPPNHARVCITIPGSPDALRVDLKLSEVLAKKDRDALAATRDTLVQAALTREGYTEVAEPESEA